MWRKFRKFGLEYSDLPTMICNVNILLRILTLNIDSRLKTPIPLGCYLLTAFCTVCYYYLYQFSMVWFVVWRSPLTGDLAAAMVYGFLGISSQISTSKLFYMLFNGPKLRWLVDQCLEIDALSEPDSRFCRRTTKVLRKVKMRAVAVWICIMMISISYCTVPVFMSGRHLPEDLLIFYGLEPMFQTPNFQISYALMTICVTFICYITSTITAFSIIIIGCTEAQMIALSKEMLSVWDDSVNDAIDFDIDYICPLTEENQSIIDNDTKLKINVGVRRRLIQIVRTHSRNVALIKNLNEFLYVPNAVAFGCLVISLIAELLGGLENTYLQIPFTFIQVAMDCYTGQKITDASAAFESAVYSCKWENFDKDNMKIVLLMLQNSQKTLSMSAGGMAELNFGSLMSIVKSVYSAYTTLRKN